MSLVRPGCRPILVRAFPAERHFVDDLRRIVLGMRTLTGDEEELRDGLEIALRAWYPRVTVHQRSDFGALDGTEIVWYALRDGRVRPEDPRIDRLHAALATARGATDEAEAAIRHSREAVSVAADRHGERVPAGDPPEAEG